MAAKIGIGEAARRDPVGVRVRSPSQKTPRTIPYPRLVIEPDAIEQFVLAVFDLRANMVLLAAINSLGANVDYPREPGVFVADFDLCGKIERDAAGVWLRWRVR